MTTSLQRPRLLRPSDAISGFVCDSEEQTDWLVNHARQANAVGNTKVFVVVERESDRVVAYYAWTMATIAIVDAPERLRKGAGRYPQPMALLARLGVDRDFEGQGIGAALLQDVVSRTATIGTEIGCRGLLVHAESERARDFYRHLIPEFEESPTSDLHLCLLMKDIARTLS